MVLSCFMSCFVLWILNPGRLSYLFFWMGFPPYFCFFVFCTIRCTCTVFVLYLCCICNCSADNVPLMASIGSANFYIFITVPTISKCTVRKIPKSLKLQWYFNTCFRWKSYFTPRKRLKVLEDECPWVVDCTIVSYCLPFFSLVQLDLKVPRSSSPHDIQSTVIKGQTL